MNITWNAEKYRDDFSFVPEYGTALLDLLDAPPGAQVVDLGCGSGGLTGQLAARGYRVTGVDASAEMLTLARQAWPDIPFFQADARNFTLEEPADAIFSNAVLHWIDAADQPALVANLAAQLRTGGQLVCEFGGKGCAEQVHATLDRRFSAHGLAYRRAFYFPTIGEYAPLLEQNGLRVTFAALFDRPTRQQTVDGLVDWIRMFDMAPFQGVDPALAGEILREAEEELRPILFRNGAWYIDYVRIRLRAVKE